MRMHKIPDSPIFLEMRFATIDVLIGRSSRLYISPADSAGK